MAEQQGWTDMSELMADFMQRLKERRPYRPNVERMRIMGRDRVQRDRTPEEQARVARYIESHDRLKRIVAIEPMLQQLLEEASICTEGNRWHLYEYFKRASSPFVGWDACDPELCTSSAYETFIDALDALLPEEKWEEVA